MFGDSISPVWMVIKMNKRRGFSGSTAQEVGKIGLAAVIWWYSSMGRVCRGTILSNPLGLS